MVGVTLAALWGGSAWAQASGVPTAEKCAAVYGAFAQDQANFGSSDSLLGERYFNFSRINFEERLTQLAGKAEKGVTELKTATEADRAQLYMKLVDAETEGDMASQAIRDMIRQSDSCDAEFGFSPSLGG
jgi:hypothetical protein